MFYDIWASKVQDTFDAFFINKYWLRMINKVLILNADFQPITICSVYKAFILVYLEKAEIIAKNENDFLRTVSQCFNKPVVIRLINYVNIPFRKVSLTRTNVF